MSTPPLALPRRVAWFAPWTWSPWTRWVAAGLFLATYPLSIGPAVWLVSHHILTVGSVAWAYRPLLSLIFWTNCSHVEQYMYLWGGEAANDVMSAHIGWEICDW